MARKYTLDDVVTQFLLNTCRLRSQPSEHDVEAALRCGELVEFSKGCKYDWWCIPLVTGSVAEFYIEPMLPLFGDIDVMFYCNNRLAIPRGHPPPTQLPAEFHNYVQVHEIIDRVPHIIDSHLPGYVYLELRYLLTESSDDDKYNAVEYDRGHCFFYRPTLINPTRAIHGPAECAYSQNGRLITRRSALRTLSAMADTSR